MSNTIRLFKWVLLLNLFWVVSCSVQMDTKVGAIKRLNPTPESGEGGDIQSLAEASSVEQVKILNQKQIVESLVNTLEIAPNSRPTLMAEWERVKSQLSINGTGNEYSTAVLSASTRLVAQACNLVPVNTQGLPPAPVAGTQPSSQMVQQIANFFSNRFLNRQLGESEMGDLTSLVSEVYNSTISDAAKFRMLNDMICTVIGTSSEAQVL